MVEPDRRAVDAQRRRAGLVGHLGGLLEQVEHLAHIDQRLADLPIDRAEEVQRHGDLDHEGVDHHEIAHRQRTRLHAGRRHDHHHDKPGGDDQRLTGIEEGKRDRGLHRRGLVAGHGPVIAIGLARLGAEILHRLEIQQAVDRLLVRVGVLAFISCGSSPAIR
jgi:hypothetical protein